MCVTAASCEDFREEAPAWGPESDGVAMVAQDGAALLLESLVKKR